MRSVNMVTPRYCHSDRSHNHKCRGHSRLTCVFARFVVAASACQTTHNPVLYKIVVADEYGLCESHCALKVDDRMIMSEGCSESSLERENSENNLCAVGVCAVGVLDLLKTFETFRIFPNLFFVICEKH